MKGCIAPYVEGQSTMTVRLTYCGRCARSHAEFRRVIEKLKAEYPHDLRAVEVECMAACGDPPVAMIDYDFMPHAEAKDIYERVVDLIDAHHAEE